MILFLDFDGVLHGFTRGKLFTCLARFEKIILDYPDIKIVFSTSWRFNQSFEKLVGYFDYRIRHQFIGVTPTVQEPWPPYVKHERHKEILKYCEDANYTGPWVAIDDAADLFKPDLENLVVTDGNIGLDEESEKLLRAALDKYHAA